MDITWDDLDLSTISSNQQHQTITDFLDAEQAAAELCHMHQTPQLVANQPQPSEPDLHLQQRQETLEDLGSAFGTSDLLMTGINPVPSSKPFDLHATAKLAVASQTKLSDSLEHILLRSVHAAVQTRTSDTPKTSDCPNPSGPGKLPQTIPKVTVKTRPITEEDRLRKYEEVKERAREQSKGLKVTREPSKRTVFYKKPITGTHVIELEHMFRNTTHPRKAEIQDISMEMGYPEEKIRIWFKNKRKRMKT